MESLLIILVVFLIVLNVGVLFYLVKNKPEVKQDNTEQVLKDELNSLRDTFNQSFGSMTKDIAKDMTGALTRVDEKVGVFNQQVEVLNKSQENFSRILAGVKQYGVLAEFSLASLLKDMLPASQFIANVKMKPDETSDTVEFAIKLQDVLVPLDSHWPIEKFKAIDDAYQAKDKDALAEARKELASAFRNKAKAVSSKYISPLRRQILQLFMHQQKDYLQSFQVIEIQRLRNYYFRNLEPNIKSRSQDLIHYRLYCSLIT